MTLVSHRGCLYVLSFAACTLNFLFRYNLHDKSLEHVRCKKAIVMPPCDLDFWLCFAHGGRFYVVYGLESVLSFDPEHYLYPYTPFSVKYANLFDSPLYSDVQFVVRGVCCSAASLYACKFSMLMAILHSSGSQHSSMTLHNPPQASFTTLLHNPPCPSTTLLHNPPQHSTTLDNPQRSTMLHNPTPQRPTILHDPPQPSTTLHNPPQPSSTTLVHNPCPQPSTNGMPQRQILGAVGGGFEACRSMPQHAAASQNCHMADFFFFHNMSNLWTLCCTDISVLDGSSVVYVAGPSFRGPGFPSCKWQNFACQFSSIVAQIFAFLVLFCHVKS